MNDNLWYKRYPRDYLADTLHLDPKAECAYNRLIEYYYATGTAIPDDPENLQNIGKIKDMDYMRIRGVILQMGFRSEGGFLRHKRIDSALLEQAELAEKRTHQTEEARKAALAKRAVTQPVTETVTQPVTESVTETKLELELDKKSKKEESELKKEYLSAADAAPTEALKDKTSPGGKRFQKPSIEAALLYAAKLGMSRLEAEKFLDHYEANGWRVGKVPMKDWEAAMRNWNKNLQAQVYAARHSGPPSQPSILSKNIDRLAKEVSRKRGEA